MRWFNRPLVHIFYSSVNFEVSCQKAACVEVHVQAGTSEPNGEESTRRIVAKKSLRGVVAFEYRRDSGQAGAIEDRQRFYRF